MGILTAKYSFIREDVQIIAEVDEETGEQQVILQQIDINTRKILRKETIQCIHYAVTHPAMQKELAADEDSASDEEEIFVLSSENLGSSPLATQDLFQALNSWAGGIAEMGTDAFRILSEIEDIGGLGIPISGQIFRFMALVDQKIALEYLDNIKNTCVFEGQRHDPSMIASMRPILDALFLIPEDSIPVSTPDIFDTPTSPAFPHIEIILEKIFNLDPPLELFTENIEMVRLLQNPLAINLADIPEAFSHPKAYVRKAIASNPMATESIHYAKFLSEATEPDESVRRSAARHEKAPKISEYANFFSKHTESSPAIRQLAAENPQSVHHPEFASLLTFRNEDELGIFRIALTTLKSFKPTGFQELINGEDSPLNEILFILELQDLITAKEVFYKDRHSFLSFDDLRPEMQREFKYRTEGSHIISITARNCNLTCLPQSLTHLTHLKELNLEGNAVKDMQALLILLPNVQIHS